MAKLKLNLKTAAPQVLGLTAGNVATGFIAKMVPVDNVYLKNGAALLAGVLLMSQKGIMGHVGAGMASAAGANLLRSAVPAIGALEDEIDGLGGDDEFLIEGNDGLNGSNDGLNGNEEDDN